MIAIFNTKQDAENYSAKVHDWMQRNCPLYNAIKWQDATPNKDGTQFYIEIPKEYYEPDIYKDSDKIIDSCKTEFQKVTTVKEKPDPVLWSKDEEIKDSGLPSSVFGLL